MKKDTRYLVSVALMAAIVILLANTPLGMIQLPIIKATTVHIPVIIGAILLGPSAGAILGAIFGICSLISNTTAPTLLSFAFSPFLSTTGLVGVVKAIWISVGCRIMIGVISGWLWILFRKLKANSYLSLIITGFVGSMVNTIFVMGSIYLLFAGRTVCRCQRCGTHRGVRPDHGYGHCIRHPGSDCCRNPCHCHHKSTAEGCS